MIDIPRRIRVIIERICAGTEVTLVDVLGRGKPARVVEIRARCMRAVKTETGWSLPRIGRIFGRDHTTILHALRKQDRDLDNIPMPDRLTRRHNVEVETAPAIPIEALLAVLPKPEPLPIIDVAKDRPEIKLPDNATLRQRLFFSERKSVARLLFVHGPNCFAPFEVDARRHRQFIPPPPFVESMAPV